ncbi:MAG: DMT family transporter [Oscillospiraceae bacterium]|nr:DMT family transporter [Oscillospiraceae bacterium]
MKKYLPLICNLVAAVIFGFAMLFMKTGMRVVGQDTVKFLAFRFTVGFITLNLLLLFKLQKVCYKGKPLGLLLLCGALNPLISQVLETSSTTYAPTAQIAVFMSLVPILVVVFSVFINKERPSRRQIFFMLVSILGVFVINFVGGQMHGGTAAGMALILSAMLVISLGRVFVRRASASFTPFETIYITTGMGSVGFTLATVFSHAAKGALNRFFSGLWTADFIVSVLYMGIASCVIAFLCLTYATGNLPIAVSASTGTLSTVISILVGVFILGERFRVIDIVGAVIILGGIVGMSLSYEPHAGKLGSAADKSDQKEALHQ